MNFKITYLYFIAISILVIACSGGRKEQEKEKVVPYSEEKKNTGKNYWIGIKILHK